MILIVGAARNSVIVAFASKPDTLVAVSNERSNQSNHTGSNRNNQSKDKPALTDSFDSFSVDTQRQRDGSYV